MKQHCHKNKSRSISRNSCGVAIAEMAAGLTFLLVLVLVCVDAGLMLYGAFINDRVCRNAARAAAQGKSVDEAYDLAYASLKLTAPAVAWVKSPEILGDIEYQDYGGNFTPIQSPFVSVTTRTEVNPPAPIFFFGAQFIEGGKLVFLQTYTFPIVRVK